MLAAAAVRALSREHPLPRRWGVPKTVLLSALTFGIAPLYIWPGKLKTAATIEQQQLWHLAQWIRLQSGHAEGERLSKLAERAGFKPLLWVCSMFCLTVTVAVFALQAAHWGMDLRDIQAATYSYGRMTPQHFPFPVARQLFVVWTAGLCAAYTIHWFHLQLHQGQVKRFVEALNVIAEREQIRPVPVRSARLGFRPIWALGGILMVGVGAIWAIPMVLAGALQARWPEESRQLRGGMSEMLREMLMMRRPVLAVPRPAKLGEFCMNDLCRGRVPPQAQYCPRCGLCAGANVASAGKVA